MVKRLSKLIWIGHGELVVRNESQENAERLQYRILDIKVISLPSTAWMLGRIFYLSILADCCWLSLLN